MEVFAEYDDPIITWLQAGALPAVIDTLAQLHPLCTPAVATNARITSCIKYLENDLRRQ
jgi:hypothetical protein